MNKKDVKYYGKTIGYDIAKENEQELLSIGMFDDDMIDQFASDMAGVESEHFRQFSPFEFFAHDLNTSHDPDGLWDAYDDGVWEGINKRVKEIKREYKDCYMKTKEV